MTILSIQTFDVELLGVCAGVSVVIYAVPFIISMAVRGVFRIMDT